MGPKVCMVGILHFVQDGGACRFRMMRVIHVPHSFLLSVQIYRTDGDDNKLVDDVDWLEKRLSSAVK